MVVRRRSVEYAMMNMLLVHSSTLKRMMMTKPMGKTKAASMVAMAGLLDRRLGEPPATTRSKAAPSEMKTPPRKDLMIRSSQLRLALATPACSARRSVSTGVWASTPEVMFGGARVLCSPSSDMMGGSLWKSTERILRGSC